MLGGLKRGRDSVVILARGLLLVDIAGPLSLFNAR
jgi:hypothetical protein